MEESSTVRYRPSVAGPFDSSQETNGNGSISVDIQQQKQQEQEQEQHQHQSIIVEGRSSLASTPVSYYSSDDDDEEERKQFQTPPPEHQISSISVPKASSLPKKTKTNGGEENDEDPRSVNGESFNIFSVYGIVSVFFGLVLSIFFRNVGFRGLHKIPKKGPVIFVAAPHCNQFVDPMVLMHILPRPVYFLIAAKSMGRKIIGFFGRLAKAIPVTRPQDLMVKGGKNGLAKPVLDGIKILAIAKAHANQSSVGESEFTTGRVLIIENFDLLSLKMPEKALGWQISLSADGPIVSADAPGISTYAVQEIIASASILLLRKPIPDTPNQQYYFNLLPVIDQSSTYDNVYERLLEGHCIGIFPEGGSHDRAEMLPLKAGVTIMALGAMCKCFPTEKWNFKILLVFCSKIP